MWKWIQVVKCLVCINKSTFTLWLLNDGHDWSVKNECISGEMFPVCTGHHYNWNVTHDRNAKTSISVVKCFLPVSVNMHEIFKIDRSSGTPCSSVLYIDGSLCQCKKYDWHISVIITALQFNPERQLNAKWSMVVLIKARLWLKHCLQLKLVDSVYVGLDKFIERWHVSMQWS